MSVTVERQAIIMSLQPLFEEAEAKELWFFHESGEVGEIWCSPEFLKLKQSQGDYVWAPEHWELRSPMGYMQSLKSQIDKSVEEFNTLATRFDHDRELRLTEVVRAANQTGKA